MGRSDGHVYIYYKIEQQASTKTKGEDQTDIYIYTKGEDQTNIYIYTIRLNRGLHQSKGRSSDGHIYILSD